MSDYKSKPARIVDKLRKIWKKPPGGTTTNFGTSVGGVTQDAYNIANSGNYPVKKKPKRKGRPD